MGIVFFLYLCWTDLKGLDGKKNRNIGQFVLCPVCYKEGVNRGMQIRRSVFAPVRQSAGIFLQIRKVNVNATVTSNFAQIVKKVTYLMTITEYNSNNSIIPEFK